MKYAVKGDIIYSKNYRELHEYKNSYVICEDGYSKGVYKKLPRKYENIKIYDYTGHLITPGLCDLHLHAPQYAFVGMHMDLELIDWLNNYTFKEESKYNNLSYAKKAYDLFINDLRKSPTTRYSLFATLHKEATKYLFDIAEKSGLKGYIGKVNQDRNNIKILNETTKDSIHDTLEIIEYTKKFKNTKYIITPRFIPSCTDELLNKLSLIAKEKNLPIQSHLSENRDEIKWVKELVKKSKSYAHAYSLFNMLGNQTNTIMAHCVWPEKIDFDLLKNNKVWVAHSPSSNRNLSSGIAPIRKYINNGIKVGLATDVAGGSYLSMFRAIEDMITSSKIRYAMIDKLNKAICFAEAFYCATIGGGSFFGKVGSFDKGYEFDLLVLDESKIPTVLIKDLTLIERLERFVYRPNDTLVAKFVAGKKISLK